MTARAPMSATGPGRLPVIGSVRAGLAAAEVLAGVLGNVDTDAEGLPGVVLGRVRGDGW
jgi:hypothetical protein